MSRINLTVQSIVQKERSPVAFNTYQIDAANLATWLTGWGAFKTALDAIILGVLAKEVVALYDTDLSGAMPTSPFARRETKLLLRYSGNVTGDVFRIEIPTPDLAALTYSSGDENFINLADGGVMAQFVTDFESIARSPDDDSETVTVISAQVVGRNI